MGESKKDDKKKERSSSSWKNPKKKKPKDVNDNEPQLDKADKVKGRDNNSKTLTGNGAAGVKRDMLRELSDISMSFRLAVAPIEELVNEDKDEQREDDANSQKPTTATPTKKRRKPKTKNKVKRRAPQRLKFAPKEEEEPQQQQVGLTLELDRRDFVKSNMEISALTIENEFSKRDVLSPDSTSSDNTNVTDANTEFSWTPPKSNIDFYSSAVAPFSSQPKQSEIALSRIVSNRRLVPKEYAANPEDARLSLMSFPSVLENEWFGDFGAVDSKPEINIPAAASKNPKKTTSSDKPCTTVSPGSNSSKRNTMKKNNPTNKKPPSLTKSRPLRHLKFEPQDSKRDMLRELSDISMSFKLSVAPIEEPDVEAEDQQEVKPQVTKSSPRKSRRKPKSKNKVKRRAPGKLKFAPIENFTLEVDRRDFLKTDKDISTLSIQAGLSQRNLAPASSAFTTDHLHDKKTEETWKPPSSNVALSSNAAEISTLDLELASEQKTSEISLSNLVSQRELEIKNQQDTTLVSKSGAGDEDPRMALMSFPSIGESEWSNESDHIKSENECMMETISEESQADDQNFSQSKHKTKDETTMPPSKPPFLKKSRPLRHLKIKPQEVKREMLSELSDISMSFKLSVAPIEEPDVEAEDQQEVKPQVTKSSPRKSRRKPKSKNKVKRRAPGKLKFAPIENFTLEVDRRDFLKTDKDISTLSIQAGLSQRNVSSAKSSSEKVRLSKRSKKKSSKAGKNKGKEKKLKMVKKNVGKGEKFETQSRTAAMIRAKNLRNRALLFEKQISERYASVKDLGLREELEAQQSEFREIQRGAAKTVTIIEESEVSDDDDYNAGDDSDGMYTREAAKRIMAGKELEDSDDEDEDSESSESSNDDDEDDGDELGALYAQAGVMQPARVQAETMQHEEPIKSQDGLFASAANFDSKVNKQQPAHKGIQDKTNRGQFEPGNKYILEETDKSERFSGLDNFHRMQIADRFEAHPPVLDFASKAEDSSKPAWLADLKMEVSRQRAELVEIQKVENKTRALGAKKKRFQYVGSSDDDDDNDDNANPVVLERASLLELQNFHIKSHICLRDSISDLEDDLAAQLAAQVQIEELAKRGQEQAMKKMVMDETSESESDEDISRFHARAAESKNDKDMTLIFTRTPQSSNNFGRDSILSVDGDLIQEHNQALAEIQEAARLSQEQAKAKKIQVSAEEPNDQRSDVMHSFKKAEAKKKRQQLKALKFTKDDISRRWAIESLRSINEDSIENQGDVLEAIQEKARSAQSQALNMIIETDDEEEDEEDLYQVQRKAIALKRASELRQLNLERADEKLELSDDSSIGSLEDVVARHELIHAEIQSNWNHTHE